MKNEGNVFNSEKLRKQNEWERMSQRINMITDRLGTMIDQNIKESVIALNVLGINTTQSCEGHLSGGTYAPYIDIETKDIEQLQKELKAVTSKRVAEEIWKEIERKNLEERKKLMNYLEEFYRYRTVPYYKRLIVEGLARGWTRLESQGVDLQKIASLDEREKHLLEFQEEMRDFTTFLKDKFFEQ